MQSRTNNRLGLILILAGIAVILSPAFTYLQSMGSQRQLLEEWDRPASVRPGKLGPTMLSIPEIYVRAMVVEGITDAALRRGPGHFPGTALPGDHGNCCIAGHRNMYGAWFRRLDRLSKGDYITVEQSDWEFTYRVIGMRTLSPKDLSPLRPSKEPRLTLITCTPMPKPTHRLVVTAELVEMVPR